MKNSKVEAHRHSKGYLPMPITNKTQCSSSGNDRATTTQHNATRSPCWSTHEPASSLAFLAGGGCSLLGTTTGGGAGARDTIWYGQSVASGGTAASASDDICAAHTRPHATTATRTQGIMRRDFFRSREPTRTNTMHYRRLRRTRTGTSNCFNHDHGSHQPTSVRGVRFRAWRYFLVLSAAAGVPGAHTLPRPINRVTAAPGPFTYGRRVKNTPSDPEKWYRGRN